MKITTVGVVALAVALVACKDDKPKLDPTKDDKPPVETKLSPLEPKTIGFEKPNHLGYKWGKGRKAFERATEMLKAEKRDYTAIADAAQEAVTADANHLEAHRLLGIALTETGKVSEGLDHLSTALAADWLRWGPELAGNPPLQDLFKKDDGKLLLDLNEKYRAAFYEQAAAGIQIVAKRTKWKRPTKVGERAWAATRAELFSYTTEGRYLRLTSSGESVAGVVTNAAGSQIAILQTTDVIASDTEIRLHRPSVQVIDAVTFLPIGKKARAKGDALVAKLAFDEAGELVLELDDKSFTVDFMAGKLGKRGKGTAAVSTTFQPIGPKAPTVLATATMSRLLAPNGGISKGAAANQFVVDATKQAVSLPDAGGPELVAVGVSPEGGWVAFVGSGKTKADSFEPALYVAKTSDGKPTFVHRGSGTHAFRWLSEGRLAFEASTKEIKLFDAASGSPCCSESIKSRYELGLATASNEQAGAVRPGVKPEPEPAPEPADGTEPADGPPDAEPSPN